MLFDFWQNKPQNLLGFLRLRSFFPDRRRNKKEKLGMGLFAGHVLPGSLFLVVGAWHIWSASALYVSDPGSFRARAWHPVGSGRMQHLELYAVAGGALIDMGLEVLYATQLHFFVGPDGVLNPLHMKAFEHGGMLLMFFLFAAAALLSQNTRFAPLPEGALFLIASAVFSAEYLLFYFHSTTHKGLEGYYHLVLVILVALCIAATVACALFPTCFPVDLASGISITLQGLWFYQTAFTLYGPMMPRGCYLDDSNKNITCGYKDSQLRGELLANFQLFSLIFLVFIYVLGSYAVAASWYGHPELRSLHAGAIQDGGEDEKEQELAAN